MSTFSAIACYSALSACSKEDVLNAYARMVASIVQKKRYDQCDANVLCVDFEEMYGFPVPFHPMKTIMEYCAYLGFFTYNTAAHAFFPNYDNIDKEDFIMLYDAEVAVGIEMKDINIDKNDLFQAKQYLLALQNNYHKTDDISTIITEKLAHIHQLEVKQNSDTTLNE